MKTHHLLSIVIAFAIVPLVHHSGPIKGAFGQQTTTLASHSSSVNCVQPPPTLQQPLDGSQVESLIPSFVFGLVPGVTDYRFELATDVGFQSMVLTERIRPVGSPTIGITGYDENLEPQRTYYWRMASFCGNEIGPYSQVHSFITTTGVLPAVPTVTNPEDGTLVASTRVVFSIESTEGYNLRFYNSPSAAWTEPGWWGVAWNSPHPLLVQEFPPGQNVYWRIAGRNPYANGEPQPIRSFTTPPSSVVASVDPSTGGTLVASARSVTLDFPPTSVSEPVTVTYRLQSRPSGALFGGSLYAGRSFSVEAINAAGNPVNTFLQPFTLTITYDPLDLLVAGIDNEANLNVVFWQNGRWHTLLPCDGCQLNTTTNTVTVRLQHLTEFALILPRWQVSLPIVLSSTEQASFGR